MDSQTIILVCTTLGTGIAIVGAVVSAIRYYQQKAVDEAKRSLRLDSIEKSLASLSCAKHSRRLSSIEKQLASLNTSIRLIGYSQQHSPLSPTEKGWKAIRHCDIQGMVDRNWDKIKADIDSLPEKTPYRIQERTTGRAMLYPEDYLSHDELARLEAYAYQEAVPVIAFTQLLGILARDRYFAENGIVPDPADFPNDDDD